MDRNAAPIQAASTQVAKRRFRPEALALGAAALVCGAAVGIAVTRSPSAPEPVASASLAANSIEALEARAKASPNDLAVLAALAQAYFDAERYEDAAATYQRATAAAPQRAMLWSSLGEAQVMASKDDPMPATALANFRKAAQLDAKDPRARYFLAVKQDLDGDHEGAIKAWLALLGDTPPGAPWEADLKRTIEQVGRIAKIPVTARIAAVRQPAPLPGGGAALAGPSAEDLAKATTIPPSEQRGMAEGMVARLEARLKSDPRNVDGWIMLMRSRMTLGQPDAARAARDAAVAANPSDAQRLRSEARALGVG